MMLRDLRPAIRQYLLDDAAISTAVGGSRVFPLVLPQGVAATSIVYTLISAVGDHHMQGPSGLNRPRYQIDAWAPTLDGAVSLADLIKDRIDGFAGTVMTGPESPQVDSVVVQGVFFINEREDYDAEADLFRRSRDYLIWFEER